MTTNVRVNAGRLWSSLMEMAAIGATAKGGVRRIGLSDEDRQGRDLFRRWCDRQGYAVRIDPCGNMFARRAGTESGLAPVVIGSHLDSQPTGGKFDGAFGVLAALEVMRTLDDLGVTTRRPIEIVNWIAGGFNTASWSDAQMLLPYLLVALAAVLPFARLLNALQLDEDEARHLGVNVEAVKLVVFRKDPALTAGELIAHCRKHLTGYKVPRIVEFSAEPLPKTPVGKVLRRMLRPPGAAGS